MTDSIPRAAIASQFLAALTMLEKAVQTCPDELWFSTARQNRFWHIAYHAVFYVHFYLGPGEDRFQPWQKHRPNYQFLGPTPWPPFERPKVEEPFSKSDILEYIEFCRRELNPSLDAYDLAAPSGFHWLPFNKLELHLYDLRHLQHHTGQLLDRLRTDAGIGIGWVLHGTK